MIDELVVKLNRVADLVITLLWRMTKPPGVLPPVQIAEEMTTMGKVFTYRQEFLPQANPDIAQIRLVVTVNGVVTDTQLMPVGTGATTFRAGPEGATVLLSEGRR